MTFNVEAEDAAKASTEASNMALDAEFPNAYDADQTVEFVQELPE